MKNQKKCSVRLQKYNFPLLRLPYLLTGRRRTQKGSVLVFALIVLSFILVTAFSLAAVSLIERRSSGVSVNSSTAFQNSDEGMEEFLQQLYKQLDPGDTLQDVAANLDGYTCDDGEIDNRPARIGDQNTAFIITAYQEIADIGGLDSTFGGWEDVAPIQSCAEPLANVSRFRATGNYNNASRAVFLKLRDSLTRGLVAHWSFEDRANVARITIDAERENRTSAIAQDYSKYGHTLTFCDLNVSTGETSLKIENGGTDENGNQIDVFVQSFSPICAPDESDGGMNQKRGYYEPSMDHTDAPDEEDDDEYDANGSWVAGIVEESPTTSNDAISDTSNSEALRFDGDEYLATWFEATCDDADVNCIEDGDNKLDLKGADDDADGIAISVWVQMDHVGTNGIVSRYQDSGIGRGGYQMWIQNRRVNFRLRNGSTQRRIITSSQISDTGWTHIVATWRNGADMKIYVNGDLEVDDSFSPTEIAIPDRPLFIGAGQNNSGDAIDYFNGTIDDVRIWNRALTENEVCRLCKDADKTGNNTNCDPNACP